MVRRAFSLTELLIVIAILAILAAIVIPRFSDADEVSRREAAASMASNMRKLVQYHANSGEYAVAASGFPAAISGTWFVTDDLPQHPWTGDTMVLQTVAGAANDWYPATKVFDKSNATATNGWYNTTNGAFIVLLPAGDPVASTIETFNIVNLAAITDLNQTTK